MPAMLDDPSSPAIYRVSGTSPFPTPYGPLPSDIALRQVTLRDRATIATLVPFSSPQQAPHRLTAFLCELLNREIEKGDTYPMTDPMPLSSFGPYWFANFGAVMVLGDVGSIEELHTMEAQDVDWSKECLGSFYVKPNYPGRSSHVCNGGFLVSDVARNKGVGRLMGEGYLEWAPKLGYTYSVFNLVYETNVASLKIWDALGFKRIGRVKGCGNLKSYPDQFVDAIIFGRELGGEADDYVSEERFDKIRFYLKTGTYPAGSDRAEKSRLRSAATHYRLVPADPDNPNAGREDGQDDKLMLKGKEVISDPHKQYEIARNIHNATHGGINKTTAAIADKFHWVRIKETVSAAIRNCEECKENQPKQSLPVSSRRMIKEPGAPLARSSSRPAGSASAGPDSGAGTPAKADVLPSMSAHDIEEQDRPYEGNEYPQEIEVEQRETFAQAIAESSNNHTMHQHAYLANPNHHTVAPHSFSQSPYERQQQFIHHQQQQQQQQQPQSQQHQHQQHQQYYRQGPHAHHQMAPAAQMQFANYSDMPVDPQIMMQNIQQAWNQQTPSQNSQAPLDAMATDQIASNSFNAGDEMGATSNNMSMNELSSSSMGIQLPDHLTGGDGGGGSDTVKGSTPSSSMHGMLPSNDDTSPASQHNDMHASASNHDLSATSEVMDEDMMDKRLQQELEAEMLSEHENYQRMLRDRQQTG
ncbi:zf-H2C2-domain-containing protein [Hortaea werneckii]|nr:zf-H2C2-domain-containing protein [Hortaea werneckii]